MLPLAGLHLIDLYFGALCNRGTGKALCVCSGGGSANTARLVAETVQYFITAMDAVKMKMAAVDEVSCLMDMLPVAAEFGELPVWRTPLGQTVLLPLAFAKG